jgi:putative ABC transport system permease protein
MAMLTRMASFLRNVFRRRQVDNDLDAEVRSYLNLLTEEKMQSGMNREQADRAARLELEGVEQVKERVRDARSGALWHGMLQDARYAARMLVKNPAFSCAAILALALGVGANTAIFSVVNAVLLRPLPYHEPDRLVVLLHGANNPVAPANYLDWRQQNHVFSETGAAEFWTPNLADEDRPEHLWAMKLTPSMFPVLGVEPLLGRTFAADEDNPGRDQEVVLSYRIWQRRFGGDPGILGRIIKLNGKPYAIIGVMPKSFRFAPFWATKAELWAPMAFGDRAASRTGNSLRVFARLRPGVTIDQARAEMGNITARLEQQFPGSNRDVHVYDLEEHVVGSIRPALLILLGAVGFVLLIACTNVAHMLLARAAARKKEIAVRIALGARRSRLVRQFLTESLMLSIIAGGAGFLLGIWGVRILLAMTPVTMPSLEAIPLDWHVLMFTLGISMLTGIGFGLAPALQGSLLDLAHGLKENERGSTEGLRRNRLRNLLIVSEFSLALVLLVGAGLLVRTFVALGQIDPGFDPKNVLTMIVSVAGTSEQDPSRRGAFFQELLGRVRGNPIVESASAINHIPIAGDLWGYPFYIEGQAPLPPGDRQSAVYRVVAPHYFATMKARLVRGRDFTDTDQKNAPGVIIINETLANKYFPGSNPVGKRMSLTEGLSKAEWLTVVGVVRDIHQEDWTSEIDNEVYVPYLQNKDYLESDSFAMSYLTLVVRTRSDAAAFAPEIKSIVSALDKDVPVSEVQTMDDVVAMVNSQPRFLMVLIGSFALVALALAAVGIYAVMSYSVSRRTNEIGIRMALGARQADVLKLVVSQGMTVALIGAGVGIAGALLLVRVMKSLLYGVQPTDPLTFLLVPAVLCGTALLATWLPARRAAKVDPMRALRYE